MVILPDTLTYYPGTRHALSPAQEEFAKKKLYFLPPKSPRKKKNLEPKNLAVTIKYCLNQTSPQLLGVLLSLHFQMFHTANCVAQGFSHQTPASTLLEPWYFQLQTTSWGRDVPNNLGDRGWPHKMAWRAGTRSKNRAGSPKRSKITKNKQQIYGNVEVVWVGVK